MTLKTHWKGEETINREVKEQDEGSTEAQEKVKGKK